MKNKSIRSISLAIAILASRSLLAVEPPKDDAAISTKLLAAIATSNYEAFIADGEAPFKELKKEQFESVATQLGAKLNAGYEVSYLGELKKSGYRVTLWRVTYKDGSDDGLATLSLKDGKVGGYFIR